MDVLQNENNAREPQNNSIPREKPKTIGQKCLVALLVVTCLIISFFNFHRVFPFVSPPSKLCHDGSAPNYTEQALSILSKNPLIDGHVDLAIFIRARYNNHIYSPSFTEKFVNGGMEAQVDLPRLEAGKYGGAFWSAFYLCQKDIFDFSDASYAPVVRATLEQIDLQRRFAALYPHIFTPPLNASAALNSFHSHPRSLISPIAIEGLHQIGNSLSTLRLYHSLGVRYATLTWNCHNVYADAAVLTFLANRTSVKASPYWGGISLRGRGAIREMNRMGMIVDLAHVSVDTMRDVLIGQHNYDAPHSHTLADETSAAAEEEGGDEDHWTGSLAPPIFSHSSAFTLCPHPRNVPDDILWLVKQRNSVVMINFSPDFISCLPPGPNTTTGIPAPYAPNNTLSQVADHVMHIGNLIGYAHVGIGSDFDGIEGTPVGLEDVGRVVGLVAELLRRGVSEEEVVGVVGGNVMRVWGEVDRVAEELRGRGVLPLEDEVAREW